LDRGALANGLERTATGNIPEVGGAAAAAGRKLTPVWLIASELTPAERAQLDLRVAGRAARRLRLGAPQSEPFPSKALLRLDPDIGLASCFGPPERVDLSQGGLLADGGGLLLRPADGTLRVERDGRRVVVTAREAILLTDVAATRLRLIGVARLDYFVLPGRWLTAEMFAAAEALRVHHRQNDALQLLGSYGAALMRGLMPLNTPALRDMAVKYMSELVAMMCEGPVEADTRIDEDRPASRLNAIKAEIEARLGERTLTAGRIAEVHGVSLRYLQKLFEGEGLTFSEFVLARRLERAMHLLQFPEEDGRSISSIAFDVGFGDLSYFNRTFRRRFGMAPRAARAKSRADRVATLPGDLPIAAAGAAGQAGLAAAPGDESGRIDG
jgi:AraC-like DNA-binding protein